MIYDEYYEVKNLLTNIDNWIWMRDHQSKGKFNGDVLNLNEWLEESYPDYRLLNTYQQQLTLAYKGDGVCTWYINEHNFRSTISVWANYNNFLEVNDVVYHINKVLNTESTGNPDYKGIIKSHQRDLETVIEGIITDFYGDIVEDGIWYTLKDKRDLWYKNKGYVTDKVTFTDFSSSGKTCRITAYKDGEVVFDSKRYSILTFFKSNYWWLEGQLQLHCKQLDTKK